MVSAAPAPILRRLSRQELALNRKVWSIQGGVYALFAVVTLVAAVAMPDAPTSRAVAFGLGLMLVSVLHLMMRPPAIGTVENHLVIAATYVLPAIAFVAIQPAGIAAVGGTMFIAPLAAVRLQSRFEIAAHMAVMGVLFFAIALAGIFADVVNQTTVIALLMLIAGNWVQAFSCLSVFEAAEAQGEELERLVRRDPVTGLGNRRLLDELLIDEVEKHRSDREAISIILLDLEGLEAFVQREGMSATHDLLDRISTGLIEALPKRAVVTRPADDEFCVVLPETSSEAVVPSVNAVSAVMAGLDLKGWRLKSATGVATWPDDATDGPVLLHVAAERLRAASIARDKAAAEAARRGEGDAGGGGRRTAEVGGTDSSGCRADTSSWRVRKRFSPAPLRGGSCTVRAKRERATWERRAWQGRAKSHVQRMN